MKFVIFLTILAVIGFASASEDCAGCPEPMDLEEAKQILDETLFMLDSLDGPHYTSGMIHEATKQVVAGIRYTINCDLIENENKFDTCDVVIVKTPWLGETEVTFKCPNQEDNVKSYHD
ncbi:sarcocystatin-A [Stomoxys calcitrans]|uniref:Cystatin domain-containing protein n=1 Tax=Stomoxys calcitrans TaxID=35570 RepID=A0A1I8P9X2_STOCA|nr:sarcocystatin-A [Stomoxys calcitrans]